jgi:hypothetical protein
VAGAGAQAAAEGTVTTRNPPAAAAISSGMKSPKKKPTGAKLRSWRVAILRSRAHPLGTVEAPDRKTAEDFAAQKFKLSEDQRKRLMIWERD